MNSPIYNHRQAAILATRSLLGIPVALLLILTLFLLLQGSGMAEAIGPFIAVVILLIIDTLFRSLTVTVSNERIQLSFGLGIIQKQFQTTEIESARTVRNRWWYGLGIRKIKGGWMYGISGLDAVELIMNDGRRFRIGTDEPNELLKAIEATRS